MLICIVMLTIFFAHGFFKDHQAANKFITENYKGLVREIVYKDGKRGLPDVKLDSNWFYFGMNEEKIKLYIRIGDSIVKESGTKTIKIYRKNENGKWVDKIFY